VLDVRGGPAAASMIYGHSPTDPVHQRDVQRRWIEWMHTYLDAPTNTTNKGGGQ
jgi:hypothetical protein